MNESQINLLLACHGEYVRRYDVMVPNCYITDDNDNVIATTFDAWDFETFEFDVVVSKKEQDRVAKLMGIPTLDEGGPDDKIIVKTDLGNSGGGDGYKIVDAKKNHIVQPNDFIQRYIDYDYTIDQHFIIDDNGDYHIYNHFLGVFGDDNVVGNNIAYLYKYPYPTNYFQKEDIDIIEKFFTKLKE